MKTMILIIATVAGMSACTSSADKKRDEMMAVANRYMEAVRANNTAAMDSLLADNYIGYGPSVNDSVNKKEAIANWQYNVANLYQSIEFSHQQTIAITIREAREAIVPGDWIANWAYLTIRYKDGRGPVNLWVNAIYKVENGKIVGSRTFYNEADVLRQLHYDITAPAQ